MPAVLAAPWFVPLITAATAGTTLGTTAYQLANAPGTPSTSTTDQQKAAQAAAQKAQQQAAVIAQSGNTQQATGGSLTPTGFTAASAKAAGVPSDLNSLMQFLASGGSGSAPVSGGTTNANGSGTGDNGNLANLSDLLKAA